MRDIAAGRIALFSQQPSVFAATIDPWCIWHLFASSDVCKSDGYLNSLLILSLPSPSIPDVTRRLLSRHVAQSRHCLAVTTAGDPQDNDYVIEKKTRSLSSNRIRWYKYTVGQREKRFVKRLGTTGVWLSCHFAGTQSRSCGVLQMYMSTQWLLLTLFTKSGRPQQLRESIWINNKILTELLWTKMKETTYSAPEYMPL